MEDTLQQDLQAQSTAAAAVPCCAPKKRLYDGRDRVCALILIVLGYCFIKALPAGQAPLGMALTLLSLYALGGALLWRSGTRLCAATFVLPLLGIAAIVGLLLSDAPFLRFISVCAAGLLFVCWMAAVGGQTEGGALGATFVPTLGRAVFRLPFSRYGSLFPALFAKRGEGKKGAGRVLLWIILGLCAAVVPCAVVVALLSMDTLFRGLLDSIRLPDLSDLFSELANLLLGLPFVLYLFGAWKANRQRSLPPLTREDCQGLAERLRFAPRSAMAAATIPLLAVYVAFFVSQWTLYVSAFAGKLPAGYTVAGYAREGFFSLCAVAAIDLCIFVANQLFTKRKNGEASALQRTLLALLCLFTLLLIATALAKLWLYIDSFGLTLSRVYAGFAMLLMAVLFLLLLCKQFIKRLRLTPVVASAITIFTLALLLCNPTARVAEYNVDRYLNGSLQTLDIEALDELDAGAVPSLCRLRETLSAKKGAAAVRQLRQIDDALRGFDKPCEAMEWNLPRLRAYLCCKSGK